MEKLIFLTIIASLFFFVAATAQASSQNVSVADIASGSCKCENYNCGCCEHIEWTKEGIDANLCTNFSYLPQDYGVSVTVTWNNYTVFNETISATNPPPLCFGIPELEKVGAVVCLRLYDLKFGSERFHGCAKLRIAVYHVIHKSIDLGCFNIPKGSLEEFYLSGMRRVLSFLRKYLDMLEVGKKYVPLVDMI